MFKLYITTLLFCLSAVMVSAQKKADYVVATSLKIKEDKDWMDVVEVLSKRHKASVVYYSESITEILPQLQTLQPRYVAFVEQPEQLNRDYVITAHQMSRKVDDDIYTDYLWGIITGYDANAAMTMLIRSAKHYILSTALNTTCELSDGKLFERFD